MVSSVSVDVGTENAEAIPVRLEEAELHVAGQAEQRAHPPGRVVVVDGVAASLAAQGDPTEIAESALLFPETIEIGGGEAVAGP